MPRLEAGWPCREPREWLPVCEPRSGEISRKQLPGSPSPNAEEVLISYGALGRDCKGVLSSIRGHSKVASTIFEHNDSIKKLSEIAPSCLEGRVSGRLDGYNARVRVVQGHPGLTSEGNLDSPGAGKEFHPPLADPLLSRAIEGDPEARRLLLERFEARILFLIRRHLSPEQFRRGREDLLRTIHLALFKSIHSIRCRNMQVFASWLEKLISCRLLGWERPRRSRLRSPTRPPVGLEATDAPEVAAGTLTPSRIVMRGESRLRLEKTSGCTAAAPGDAPVPLREGSLAPRAGSLPGNEARCRAQVHGPGAEIPALRPWRPGGDGGGLPVPQESVVLYLHEHPRSS